MVGVRPARPTALVGGRSYWGGVENGRVRAQRERGGAVRRSPTLSLPIRPFGAGRDAA